MIKKIFERLKYFATLKVRFVTLNRILYVGLLVGVAITAFVYGERVLYLSLGVLVAMPAVSLGLSAAMLFGLRISQNVPLTVVKNQQGTLSVRIHNMTPMMFGNVEFEFWCDDIAIQLEIEPFTVFQIVPFKVTLVEIPFTVHYRGQFSAGLRSMKTTDMLGLFTLRRKYGENVTIVSLPLVHDIDQFKLAMNLLTQANSRFEIKDEDYSTIADVRPYLPTDSIKRVHWKLTAKRNEWMVKVFQANALNRVVIIADSMRLPIPLKEAYEMEDNIVEMMLSIAKFCLNKGMPIHCMATNGSHMKGRSPSEFESLYKSTATLVFEPNTVLTPLSILTHYINDATGHVNAIVITARLDAELYERILTAQNNGHYVAVIYYPTVMPNPDPEKIFKLMQDANVPCFRLTKGELI